MLDSEGRAGSAFCLRVSPPAVTAAGCAGVRGVRDTEHRSRCFCGEGDRQSHCQSTRGVRELIAVFRTEDEVLQALGTGGASPSSCCPSAPRAGPYPVEQLTLCTHRLPEIPSARPSLL